MMYYVQRFDERTGDVRSPANEDPMDKVSAMDLAERMAGEDSEFHRLGQAIGYIGKHGTYLVVPEGTHYSAT